MKKLGLFMTAGNNLENWYMNGTYEREIRLYQELSSPSVKVIIFDYSSDLSWSKAPNALRVDITNYNIDVVPLYGGYTGNVTIIRLLFSFIIVLKSSLNLTHVKSNQSKGAWLGILYKIKNKQVRFLHRSGYSWSDFTFRLSGSWIKFFLTRLTEIITNIFADEIHIASTLDSKSFYNFERKKLKIVPNWVEVASFSDVKRTNKSIFIGRLEVQKRILELVEVWPEEEHLTIVGAGSLLGEIKQTTVRRNLNVKFISSMHHPELMRLLSSCKCLVNWSDFEGNPKVILEAIFCGVPVIGRNVAGVKQILELGDFGYIVNNTKELYKALQSVEYQKLDVIKIRKDLKSSTFEFTLNKNFIFLQ